MWQKTIIARLIFNLVPERASTSNLEHKRIIEALENREEREAERLIIKQNERTLKLLIKHFEKEGEKKTGLI